MTTPETTNLVPMTYPEALALYQSTRKPFSFLAAPYGVLKTVSEERWGGHIIAWPPAQATALLAAGELRGKPGRKRGA